MKYYIEKRDSEIINEIESHYLSIWRELCSFGCNPYLFDRLKKERKNYIIYVASRFNSGYRELFVVGTINNFENKTETIVKSLLADSRTSYQNRININ